MSLDKRLKKIEVSLTPREMVLLWLKEMLDAGEQGYMEKMLADPRNPRTVVLKMVSEPVRQQVSHPMLGHEELEQAVREAQKQADILMVLAVDLQSHVKCEHRAKHPSLGSVLLQFFSLLKDFTYQNQFEPTAWQSWRAMLIDTLTALWLLRNLVGAISEKYYSGHPLLFAAQQEALHSDIAELEAVAKDYNGLRGIIPGWALIDIDALLSSTKEHVETLVPLHVAMAKAKTLFVFDEGNAAGDLMDSTANTALREIKRLRSLTSQQETVTS